MVQPGLISTRQKKILRSCSLARKVKEYIALLSPCACCEGSGAMFVESLRKSAAWFWGSTNHCEFLEHLRSELRLHYNRAEAQKNEISRKDTQWIVLHICAWILAGSDIDVLERVAGLLVEMMKYMPRRLSRRRAYDQQTETEAHCDTD